MLYSKTCGEISLIRALVSTRKVWKLEKVKIRRTKKFHLVFYLEKWWKMDKNLPKPAKYLVHMPGVDGPIWRVRLVVSRVVWCFIEASKTQIFRRIDFWSFGVLLYVMCGASLSIYHLRCFFEYFESSIHQTDKSSQIPTGFVVACLLKLKAPPVPNCMLMFEYHLVVLVLPKLNTEDWSFSPVEVAFESTEFESPVLFDWKKLEA